MNTKNMEISNGVNKKNIYIIVLSAVIVLSFAVIIFYVLPEKQIERRQEKDINVLTDKKEYGVGEELKVKIENNSPESICFSSCYPYYIERKDGSWERYRYEDCPKEDMINNCIGANSVKAFELTVPKIVKGSHRLLVRACVNCGLNEAFKEDKHLFSNQFIVK